MGRLDIRFVLILATLLVALSWIPYLYGYLSAPSDKMYTGLVGRDVPGAYMYFMWEVQSRDGHHLFDNRLTPERHERAYFNLEWWALGKFLRYSGLSLMAGFHMERCLMILLAVGILSYFISYFFHTLFERRCVLVLVLFTSGLGWLFWIVEQWSGASLQVKLWDIEGINLFGYLINKPHFIRSMAFLCLTYALLLKGEESGKTRYFFLAGLGVILFGSIRPYHLPSAFILFAVFPVLLSVNEGRFPWKRIRNYAALVITSLPVVAYYGYLHFGSPLKEVWKGVAIEPLTPLEMVVWLGIPFVLALLGFNGFRLLRHEEAPRLFLYLWGGVMAVIIYAYPLIPWGMESAGPCYIIAPILAGHTLFTYLIPALADRGPTKRMDRKRLALWVMIPVMLLSLPSNGILMARTIEGLSHHSRPYYLPKDVATALDWLRGNASREAIVMSSADNGFYLPTLSGTKAFIGHGDFTVDFDTKNRLIHRFFDPREGHAFRKGLLETHDVDYLFYSDVERSMGEFNPNEAPYLHAAFQTPGAIVFKVVRNPRHDG